jgi:hypothetical protein
VTHRYMLRQNSKSTEQEISLLFQAAIVKLDKIEAHAKKDKTQVIQDLARGLEGKIPTDTIALEIVHQLRGRISERMIHDCLDEKYKQKHRVENARKQKGNKKGDNENLAAPVPLNRSDDTDQKNNEVLIDTSGRVVSGPQSPRSKTDAESSSAIDSNKAALYPRMQQGTVISECPQCKEYETQIQELRTAGKTQHIVPPDQIDFEFSIPFEDLRLYMQSVFRETGVHGKAWLRGTLDIRTGKVTNASTGHAVSSVSEEYRKGGS